MNKMYFCDIGLRNIIYNSFNEITYRVDNGALFENYVLLELWRKLKAAGTVQFFRAQSGTEVDFIAIQENEKKGIECKFKRYDKPVTIPNLTNFANEEGITHRYVINLNQNVQHNDLQYVAGILAGRV